MFHHSILLCNVSTCSTTQHIYITYVHVPPLNEFILPNYMFFHSISLSYFVFSYFLSSFFKILMNRSSADFCRWFRPKVKSHKALDIVVSTKVLFCKFGFVVFSFIQAATHQPPPYVRPWLNNYNGIDIPFMIFEFVIIISIIIISFIFWAVFVSMSLTMNLHVHKCFDIKPENFALSKF